MNLKLTIYEDDTLQKVKRTVEADRLKIPYRVSIFLLQSIENETVNTDNELIAFVTNNLDKLEKVVKATFGVTDEELGCVDTTEMIAMIVAIYKWGLEKVSGISGDEKN